jgi:hypothetical protein
MVLLASEFDKSKYFRSEDIKQERKFRVKAVTEEILEQDGGKEKKLVLWFTNDDRGLVLNKTNNRTLRGAFGDDTANWINKVIAMFPVMTEFRGKMRPGLRVRIPPPKQATVEAAAAAVSPPPAGNGASPAPTGNGAAAADATAAVTAAVATAAALAAADPELQPDPVTPLKADLDDEIPF